MQLNYKKYGQSGKAVIIVHGLFGMLDNWHNVARAMSEHLTVFTVDVRNHGNSPHTEDMSYSLICDDLNEFMDQQGLEQASFIGHSMGGKSVMTMADKYPERIEKLVVVDIAPKRYKPGHTELFKAMFDLPVGQLKSRTEADEILSRSIHNTGIRLFLLKNIERKPTSGFTWKLNLKTIYKHYDDIIGPVKLGWPFSNPTLFIKGEKSDYIRDEDESQIIEFFPNAEFVTIPNAGHWVHAENPETFTATVLDFLL